MEGGSMLRKKDMKILAHLRANSREKLTEISKKTGVPVSTIHDKLKDGYGGVLSRMTVLLDVRKLGYTVRAYIILKVKRDSRADVRAYLELSGSVNNLFKINNGFDFMFEGIFFHLRELEDFLEDLEDRYEILEHQVYYLIEDIQREKFMSNPDIILHKRI